MTSIPVATVSLPAKSSRFQFLFRTILGTLGIDRAVAQTLMGRGWNVFASPMSLALIARFLRPEEQGYYYTFGGVLALNVFFELGLTYVILQFASHEKAHLEWKADGTLEGSDVATLRLAALFKLALKWYSVAAGLALALVLPGGLYFFSRNTGAASAVSWKAPWIWLVTASALDMLASPLFAIVEGCGRISHIASMRVRQGILANIGLWLVLVLHGGLFASPVFQTINVTFEMGWLWVCYGRFFRMLFHVDASRAPFHWLREVWPFQWKIAVSWLCGYFIFQIFNPVLFAVRGPVAAGQMGMTLNVCNSLLNVSMAWMTTKASPIGVLIARKQWSALDALFFKTFRQSFTVLIVGGLLGFSSVIALTHYHVSFATRWLAPLPFAFVLLAIMINHVSFCEAQYLRAHKAEPFLWVSVTGAILTAASTLLLAKPFGALGVAAGYMTCNVIGLTLCTTVFMRKKREWHG